MSKQREIPHQMTMMDSTKSPQKQWEIQQCC
uniref:Uncharacterized protein n=1 Tax=Rhizophora mucronata TaxID=61149 RepID=A0A2P2NW58_RHIMU